jgi:ketosteroid isomerase-like protein
VDRLGLRRRQLAHPTGVSGKAEPLDTAARNAEKAKASTEPAPCWVTTTTSSAAPPDGHRHAPNTITTTEGGKEQTSYSRSVHVFEKRCDRWQVVSNAGHPLSESTALLYLERDWNQAEMKKDAAWFERMLASDYTGVDGRTGKTVSKAENIADIKTITTDSASLSGLDVRLKGDTAVITGLSHNKGKDGKGAAFDRTIRFTDVWVKRDGKWQVLSSHGSDVK